jgi:predicted PP-loop superfamily ATPase
MLEGLKVEIRVKAMRAAFCHEDASVVYARLRDVEKGSIEGRLFCGNCDSQYGRTPVDVISIDDELPR